MRWKGLACVLVVLLGIVLFLYGANYYDAVVGWTGIGFFIGGIIAYALLRVFWPQTKGASGQKP